ncbi:MAG TPA: hypothetical protein PLK21_05235 [Candidatus Syntrophosphaera sp.]|jgi:hypothetical protein|nr:hypothetical protein [Candidatus Syntrophosphaera sp.]HOH48764.1 hypothetical protein [Candidatus Syntrophosphaera sp.]HPW37736.1 hypothetical protein [Candidatus Syntrophosphaera sp.]HQC47417.1 hypothetical protein [Candidatus Syntrophosphaera sp.]
MILLRYAKIFLVLMLGLFFTQFAWAQVRIYIDPPEEQLYYSESTTLAVKIEGLTTGEALRGYQIHLDFDNTYLEVSGVTAFQEGEFLSAVGPTQWFIIEENGGYTATCSILGYTTGAIGSGTLFYVNVSSKDLSTGPSGTPVELSDVILRDPLNQSITAGSIENGVIHVRRQVRIYTDPALEELYCYGTTTLAVKIEGLEAGDALRGYQVHLDFDDIYLAVTGLDAFQEGEFLSDVGPTQWFIIEENGGYTATCSILGYTLGAIGEGTLFYVTLNALDQTTGPEGTDVLLSDVILRDPLNQNIQDFTLEHGKIVIQEGAHIWIDLPHYDLLYYEEVRVAVKIEGLVQGTPLRGYQVHFDFDDTYLEVSGLEAFEEGEFLSDVGQTQWFIIEENGGYTATCSILGYTPGAYGMGTLFYVTLKAKDQSTGPEGTDVLLSDVILRDPLNHAISYGLPHGLCNIVIEPPLYIYTGLKVFLLGPYVGGGTMTHVLSDNGYIPLTSPYDANLTLTAFPDVSPHYIVDWIYIQLRATSTGPFEQPQSCFLLDDGTVVDVNGNPELAFDFTEGMEYYIVVQHRNHLEVMSAQPVVFSPDPETATVGDLTLLDSVWGGNVHGVYTVEPTVLALCSGEANQDGQVSLVDANAYWRLQTGLLYGYYIADFNLDGNVGATDCNFYWRTTSGKISQVQ